MANQVGLALLFHSKHLEVMCKIVQQWNTLNTPQVPEMKEKLEAENYTTEIISQLIVHGMHMWKVMPLILSSQCKLYSTERNKKVVMRSQQANKQKIFRKIKNSLNLWRE